MAEDPHHFVAIPVCSGVPSLHACAVVNDHLASVKHDAVIPGCSLGKLDAWIHDAWRSRLLPMQRFACPPSGNLAAVIDLVTARWRCGELEGQIGRLRTLRRAMFGRPDIDLVRAQMLPPQPATVNGSE